jgi:hypothetical protein
MKNNREIYVMYPNWEERKKQSMNVYFLNRRYILNKLL